MWAFYQDTGSRKWGHPYLTREFFDLIGERMGERILLFLACATDARSPVRSTSSGRTRFMAAIGGLDEVPFLHFELCYYRAIEWAIDHGWRPFRRAPRASTRSRVAMSR